MMNPFAQLVDLLVGLYISIVLLRFFLQYFKADFYNPLSQFVVKATDPLIKPLRKIVPGFGGIDVSSLLLAYLLIIVKLIMLVALAALANFNLIYIFLYAVIELLQSVLRLFMYLIFIRIILSWMSPDGYNPVMLVIGQVCEPIIAKFRAILPPMSGFDFSPMLALIAIYFLKNVLSFYLVPMIQYIAY